ncbi:MAG: CAP domain-containing protein [Anaerolineales bacterium]|nr:CAP domain-containing protein [Anaerolineales bacterium]
MIEAINDIRRRAGLPALALNGRLVQAAQGHARDLASGRVNLNDSHTGSDGSSIHDRLVRAGYKPVYWREITGWGFDGDATRMLDYWLNSPVHYAAIHSTDVDEMGWSYVYRPGSPWGHYWVVEFGRGAELPAEPPSLPYSSHIPVVVAGSSVGAPTSAEIDLLDYLRGDGRAYMVRHPDGNQEKFRTVVRPANRWLQLKNSQWEEFWFTDDYIWRGVDTSPGDGQYYRQFEDSQEGARWCPRRMDVGQGWIAPVQHTVQTYRKSDCAPVDHHRNGRTTNRLRLVARHERTTWNGVTVEDVIEVVSSTGESMWFGRGYGLVAWRSGWGESAISYLLPAHEADNEAERGCFG